MFSVDEFAALQEQGGRISITVRYFYYRAMPFKLCDGPQEKVVHNLRFEMAFMVVGDGFEPSKV